MIQTPVATAKLSIRSLTIDELPLCEPYGRAFHAEKQVPGEFSIDVFVRNWTVYLTQYKAVLLGLWDGERLVGGLGGMVVPDLTTGIPTATEFFLFIDQAYRKGSGFVRLVDQFKCYGRAHGAIRMRMELLLMPDDDVFAVTPESASPAQRLDRVYRKRWGLSPIAVGYDGAI